MSSRSTRRAQSSTSLTFLEALLLAQATWEFGAASTNWSLIAKHLSKHPLLSRPKSFFTAQSCNAMYEHLLREAGLDFAEANYIPHAETNLILAQKYYRSRFEELRQMIAAEEEKFKAIIKEIEDIRAGLLGTEIQPRPIEAHIEEAPSDINVKNVHIFPVKSREKDETTRVQDSPLNRTEDEVNRSDVRSTRDNTSWESISQIQDNEQTHLEELPTSRQDDGCTDRRQEEEEEEVEVEEDKEEEEETSQGQVDQNEDDVPASPKSAPETESGDVVMDEKRSSDVEEPVFQARRSTRRSKLSTVPVVTRLPARTRLRARVRAADESQTLESEIDESKDNVSIVDEERISPFDPGSTRRRDGKRKASLVESVDSLQDRKRPREDSEPIEEEEGPSVHNTRARTARHSTKTEEQVGLKRFPNAIGMLHSQISQQRNGTIFLHPIKQSEVPDYHDIVKRPMDLKTIKNRIRDGIISNSLEFQRDVYLMFANAMVYNRPGSTLYAMAEDMMLESEAQINAFQQAEGVAKRVR